MRNAPESYSILPKCEYLLLTIFFSQINNDVRDSFRDFMNEELALIFSQFWLLGISSSAVSFFRPLTYDILLMRVLNASSDSEPICLSCDGSLLDAISDNGMVCLHNLADCGHEDSDGPSCRQSRHPLPR